MRGITASSIIAGVADEPSDRYFPIGNGISDAMRGNQSSFNQQPAVSLSLLSFPRPAIGVAFNLNLCPKAGFRFVVESVSSFFSGFHGNIMAIVRAVSVLNTPRRLALLSPSTRSL
jgi:hypothetical protein